MAATDQHYRKQQKLNVVFALSSVLMLLSILWMLERDYNREHKIEQRTFAEADRMLTLKAMTSGLPKNLSLYLGEVDELANKAKELDAKREELAVQRRELQAEFDVAEQNFRTAKADFVFHESKTNEKKKEAGQATSAARRQELLAEHAEMIQQIQVGGDIYEELKRTQQVLDEIDNRIKIEIEAPLATLQLELDALTARNNQRISSVKLFAKNAIEKERTIGARVRDFPILDAFAPATKIHQVYLPDLTIDYGGFKRVPRFDRCITCHMGVNRSQFTEDALASLGNKTVIDEMNQRLETAKTILKRLSETESLGFDPDKLPNKVEPLDLTRGQITEFAHHPRMDLFVSDNSPHNMDDFGCTVCHRGQGSGTAFNLASHTPNNSQQRDLWMHDDRQDSGYHWHQNHFWDFPMLPNRFVESSCIQCHYEVTDLISHGSKEQAPKLLEGYRLVRDNGCFGCHDIAGRKSDREVGPDLRAEPWPPLDWIPPEERVEAMNDLQNPPGTLRKVGPGLRRLSEKTNEKWLWNWINDPRGFRPATKMPHFYNLSTNTRKFLEEHGVNQVEFPDAEIYAIAKYLYYESELFLKSEPAKDLVKDGVPQPDDVPQGNSTRRAVYRELRRLQDLLKKDKLNPNHKRDLDRITKRYRDIGLVSVPAERDRINDLHRKLKHAQDEAQKFKKGEDSEDRQAWVRDVTRYTNELKLATTPVPIRLRVIDSTGAEVPKEDLDKLLEEKVRLLSAAEPDDAQEAALLKGRRLFTERGCLACHSHVAPMSTKSQSGANLSRDENVIELVSEAQFAPDLSRLAAKLGASENDKRSALLWLVQWLLNPDVHYARTKMPVNHLTPAQAADIAAWLLNQKVSDWTPEEPALLKDKAKLKSTLQQLSMLYLKNVGPIGRLKMQEVVEKGLSDELAKRLVYDADEHVLQASAPGTLEDKLALYVGQKAVGRLGCFGCHDVLGYESAKPIGTPLNDWGFKDPDRLAFEDSSDFADAHFAMRDFYKDPTLIRLINDLMNSGVNNLAERITAIELHVRGDANKEAQLGELARAALSTGRGNDDVKRRLRTWADRYGNAKLPVDVAVDFDGDALLVGLVKGYVSDGLSDAERSTIEEAINYYVDVKEMSRRDRANNPDKAERLEKQRRPHLKALARLASGLENLPAPVAAKLKEWAGGRGNDLPSYPKDLFTQKPVMEKYFFTLLKEHQREGFLNLKLMRPRSYDSGRERPWDERLRMPQFRFARLKPRPGEELPYYLARRVMVSNGVFDAQAEMEEAEAREAVMTFVLGLIAEEMPLQYVYKPEDEKRKIVEGRKVLERYNCAGCHQVRSGVFEFTMEGIDRIETAKTLSQLLQQPDPLGDHVFANSNAWKSANGADGRRLFIHAAQANVLDGSDPTNLTVAEAERSPKRDKLNLQMRLTQAVRYADLTGVERDVPAGSIVTLPMTQLIREQGASTTFGGEFASLLFPYLQKIDNTKFGKPENALSALPPPLIREGERVQSAWLYQFLKNPTEIRPWTVLRMPRFNMSSEDAQALVDYFIAVDRLENPKLGLPEEHAQIEQRDEKYWRAKSREYVATLSKTKSKTNPKRTLLDERLEELDTVFNLHFDDQLLDLERRLAGLDANKAQMEQTIVDLNKLIKELDDTKEEERKRLQSRVTALQTEVGKVQEAKDKLTKRASELKSKKDDQLEAFKKEWRERDAYAADAYRLLTDRTSVCFQCHSIGDQVIEAEQAPNLMLAAERLRPEWTAQWIAKPERLAAFTPMMPMNFPVTDPVPYPEHRWHFHGAAREQATAVRDVLMNFPEIRDRPVNRYFQKAKAVKP